MTLIELIKYFRTGGDEDQFFNENSLDSESEVVEIYMSKPFGIENEILLIEAEKTGGQIEFELENVKYYNLTDFYYFHDFIEDSKTKKHAHLSERKLAEILLDYCLNDG